MSGNRGVLDDEGITDTDPLTATRVADAGPVTATKAKAKATAPTPAQVEAGRLDRARTWLTRIDPDLAAVQVLGWNSPKISPFVRGHGFGAWTNSPSCVFINLDAAPRQPDRLDAWIIVAMKHESIHLKWFGGNASRKPGHPTSFLIGLLHEAETYRETYRWLAKDDGATVLLTQHSAKKVSVGAKKTLNEEKKNQNYWANRLARNHQKVMALPVDQREQAAFDVLELPANLDPDLTIAMEQLYKGP